MFVSVAERCIQWLSHSSDLCFHSVVVLCRNMRKLKSTAAALCCVTVCFTLKKHLLCSHYFVVFFFSLSCRHTGGGPSDKIKPGCQVK